MKVYRFTRVGWVLLQIVSMPRVSVDGNNMLICHPWMSGFKCSTRLHASFNLKGKERLLEEGLPCFTRPLFKLVVQVLEDAALKFL